MYLFSQDMISCSFGAWQEPLHGWLSDALVLMVYLFSQDMISCSYGAWREPVHKWISDAPGCLRVLFLQGELRLWITWSYSGIHWRQCGWNNQSEWFLMEICLWRTEVHGKDRPCSNHFVLRRISCLGSSSNRVSLYSKTITAEIHIHKQAVGLGKKWLNNRLVTLPGVT